MIAILPEGCRADTKEYAFPGVQLFAYQVRVRKLLVQDDHDVKLFVYMYLRTICDIAIVT